MYFFFLGSNGLPQPGLWLRLRMRKNRPDLSACGRSLCSADPPTVHTQICGPAHAPLSQMQEAHGYRKSKMAMDGMMSTSSGLSYHNAGDFYPRKFGQKPDVVPSGVTERKVGPLDKPDMVSVDVLNLNDPGLLC